jgi:hypothetical protein
MEGCNLALIYNSEADQIENITSSTAAFRLLRHFRIVSYYTAAAETSVFYLCYHENGTCYLAISILLFYYSALGRQVTVLSCISEVYCSI